MLGRFFTLSGLKVALVLTLVCGVAYYFDPDFLSLLELKTLDLRFQHRGPTPPTGKIALVAIDEKSLAELGRWPWARWRLAQLLDALAQDKAKVVGFDIVWAEPDENSELKGLSAVQKKVEDLRLRNRGLENYLAQALKKADTDRILADAIARSGQAVLGYVFGFNPRNSSAPAQKSPEKIPPLTAYNSVKYTSEEATRAHLFRADFAEANISVISNAAAGAGYFNIFPDRDGTVRWIPLVIEYQGSHYCALSLAVLQKYLDDPPLALRIAEFGVDEIRLGNLLIPTNEEGRMLINYRGPKNTFPHFSATDVIHGRIPPDTFRDKIVLVGATALGIYDIRVTPFDHVFPGLEIHANVIDSILQRQFLHRPNWVTLFDFLAIVLIGLILGIILPRLTALRGALAAAILLISFALFAKFLFQEHGVWVNMTYPLLNLIGVYSGITGYRYMTEELEKKRVRGAFQYYLSPPVVEQMLKNPEKLKLGGEKKNLTVLFSDIRGFTSISELMTPEALVKFLNKYLTKMTGIVFKYDGLLDKYIGDAIMAIWGAPLDQADQAERACLAGLEMVNALQILQKKWAAEGLPSLDIGIGINTGPMVVGNMGSERRFNYTVMGDSVNLGSRLEGLNKVYGTHLIVSATTYEGVREKILGRELDSVRVKGKAQSVKIYELLARKDRATSEQQNLVQEFRSALALFEKRRWNEAMTSFQSLLERCPQDGPTKIYVERCQTLENNPPETWDGIYTMPTK